MDVSNKNRAVFPLVLSVWFLLASLNFLLGDIPGLSKYANAIPYVGQDIGDFLCVIFSFLIFLKVEKAQKPMFTLLALAFAFLWSTDILFHNAGELLSGHWVLRPGHLAKFFFDVPFLLFLLLFTASLFRLGRTIFQGQRIFSLRSDYFILLSGLVSFGIFAYLLCDNTVALTAMARYLIVQTAIQLLALVMVLLILSRQETLMRLVYLGFMVLLIVDYAINITIIKGGYDVQGQVGSSYEMIWLLGVMLMAVGLRQFYFVHVKRRVDG